MTAWHEKHDLPWTKVYADWFDSLSHADLDVVTLGIGIKAMQIANARGRQPDGSGLLIGARGAPLALSVLAQRAHATIEQVEGALAALEAVGTLETRDGFYVFPNLQRWQEDPSAERQRRSRERRAEIVPGQFVYFVRLGERVKIGQSANLTHRIAQLKTEHRTEPELIGTLPGGVEEEQEFHKRFAGQRIGRSELFSIAGELAEFLLQNFSWNISGDAPVTDTNALRSRVEERGKRKEERKTPEEECEEEGARPSPPAEAPEPDLDFQLRRSLDLADEVFGPIEGKDPLASRPTLRPQLELVPPPAAPESRVANAKGVVAAWDRGREGTGLPPAREPRASTPHGKRLAAAMRAHPDPSEWEWCARALAASPFHCGQNDSGWRASFVWLLERGQGERLEEWMQRGKELRERGGKPLPPPRPVVAPGRRVGAEAKDDTAAAARRMMEENNAKMRREAAEREARARAGPAPVKMDEETRKLIDRLKGPGGPKT